MSNNEHPITPPDELVKQWVTEVWHEGTPARLSLSDMHIATQAARWGADMELDACCEYMHHEDFHGFAQELRAARRQKPPSLKKQALEILNLGHEGWGLANDDWQTLRCALEALPE